MTSVPEESTQGSACERIFAEILEQYHEHGTDPEALFARHPKHQPTLRRWWRRLVKAGEIGPAPRGQRFGQFELLEEIGAGAQGCVHLAIDTRLDRHVALKTLPLHRAVHSAAVDRFRREAAMASKLEHPGICTVFEAGEHEGIAYIAMQYIDGKTLAQRLAAAREQARPLPVDEALGLAEAIALALHTAHEAGLVHRDVKPGNIMVATDGQPVVLDFGLASDTNDNSDLTRTGDVLGTPSYMSPEQIHGGCGQLDRRTDVYSLGVVLYECLTLRRPFDGPTQDQLQQRILTAAVPDPRQWQPQIGSELVLVLQTALAKDRSHRYATARDFAEDLGRLRRRETVLAKRIGPLRRVWRWSLMQPALAATLALLVLSGLTASTTILLLYLEAAAARSEFGQLADVDLLRLARADADNLQPVIPDLAPQLAAWIEHIDPVVKRLPLHREALAELRSEATSHIARDERELREHPDMSRLRELRRQRDDLLHKAETTRHHIMKALNSARTATIERWIAELEARFEAQRIYVLQDREDAFRHSQLEVLVPTLERFISPEGTYSEMQDRLEWARTVVGKTVDAYAAEWRSAAATVASDPRFEQRALAPQVGLVPLGPDRDSGLQEFAYARGGTIPARDPTSQQLALDATSAPVLVLVPPGRFLMGASRQAGAPGYDEWANPDEGPPFFVVLDWYLIGKHELTRAQWRRLASDHELDPQFLSDEDLGSPGDVHPVTDVDWFRCTEVLARHELLLPTEAQWEYATRAGSTTTFWFGSHSQSRAGVANFRTRPADADLPPADGYTFSAPAWSMAANGFGLHHTAGNVAEWCREAFGRSAYRTSAVREGDGLLFTGDGHARALRGGSFATLGNAGRSASRGARPALATNSSIGLRVVRRVQP